MKCDIIIPIWNQLGYTKQCLKAIIKYTQYPFRLIIIDNGSDIKTKEYLETVKQDKKIDSILIRNEENLGWIKAVNQGLKMSDAPYACIMNNDTEVTDSWLNKMVEVAEKEPQIGLVNPSWEKPKGVSIHSYAKFLNKYSGEYIEVDWCRGFCILIKREVIIKIGFLDEIYGLGYYDDWDYSLRAIKAGFRCVRVKDSFVYHYRNVTVGKRLEELSWRELFEKNRQIFYQRWGRPLRLVFILDKIFWQDDILGQLKKLWLSLLRDQHLIYIWSKRAVPYPAHTNIHYRLVPFNWLIYFRICDNCRRNIGKRYDAIFLENGGIAKIISERFGAKIAVFSKGEHSNIIKDITEKVHILRKQYQSRKEL